MLDDNPLVQNFIKVFCYPTYLDWFKDEVKQNEAILISSPSNICGVVYTDKVVGKCTEDSGWNNYFYNGFKPSKKNMNYVLFNGIFYSCDFILNAFNKFFKNETSFDIRIASLPDDDYYLFMIKINSEFSLGIANLKNISIKEVDGKVAFLDTKWEWEGEDEKEVEIGRHYVDWDNGKASYTQVWRGRDWTRVVYNQDYLFSKQEEIGDSLLI